ncbi:hypothetical protein JOL79_17160 [Microbispora sp. RL4-1S]|uniref:SH3b domain-containing protein n=1 Tax=Microbispora oryzae TaxID=2806554 RepID=A0A940WM65_9ACTN|nr:SH3 domain-containing protein [Microbispora oryzae]MBP2705543.1 hypothetical protein [Microbispora oryzae]
MTVAERLTPLISAGAAAGWLVLAVPPALADAPAAPPARAATLVRPEPGPEGPALACSYRVRGISPWSHLNVREGPGRIHDVVGALRLSDGRFAGACTPSAGWVTVRYSGGRLGWVATRYLRKLDLVPPSAIVRPSLSCTYRVVNVRRGSYLNVRRGPGLRYRPVGSLTATDGRFAGGCGRLHGWVAVETSSGKPGWASGHYLHRIDPD